MFSTIRQIVQPEFQIPAGLKLDRHQKMNGLKLLGAIPVASVPLVFFDPQYRSVLDKQQYGNEGERQKHRAELPQMDDHTIKRFLSDIERILGDSQVDVPRCRLYY